MAHLKTISYIDAIASDLRKENFADLKAALEVIEAENNLTFQSISKLAMRIAAAEASATADYRNMSHRIEKLEHKGKLESRPVRDK